jgi:hypothetical protein
MEMNLEVLERSINNQLNTAFAKPQVFYWERGRENWAVATTAITNSNCTISLKDHISPSLYCVRTATFMLPVKIIWVLDTFYYYVSV